MTNWPAAGRDWSPNKRRLAEPSVLPMPGSRRRPSAIRCPSSLTTRNISRTCPGWRFSAHKMSEERQVNLTALEPRYAPHEEPNRHRVRAEEDGQPAKTIAGRRKTPIGIAQSLRGLVKAWRENDYPGASDGAREVYIDGFRPASARENRASERPLRTIKEARAPAGAQETRTPCRPPISLSTATSCLAPKTARQSSPPRGANDGTLIPEVWCKMSKACRKPSEASRTMCIFSSACVLRSASRMSCAM